MQSASTVAYTVMKPTHTAQASGAKTYIYWAIMPKFNYVDVVHFRICSSFRMSQEHIPGLLSYILRHPHTQRAEKLMRLKCMAIQQLL